MKYARRWRLVLALGLLPLVLLLIGRRIEADFGLSARYYPQIDWQGNAVLRTDREISTRVLNPLPRSVDRRPFSARWDGYLRINEPGRYIFQLISDDGSWLEIDGRGVIDNGGAHSPVLKQATVELREGVHAISVSFFQQAGGWHLDLSWAPEGQPLRPLAVPWLLAAQMEGGQFTIARIVHAALPYVPLLWLAGICAALIRIGLPFFRRLGVTEHLGDRALQGVVLLSVVLNVYGIWWGLGWRWASDEILPSHVLAGIERYFSGGWSGPYPPVQYYVLSLAYLPFIVAEWLLGGPVAWPLHLLNRLVSLLMGAGILLAWYLTGLVLGGRTAGLASAALTAVLLPFVYYAKLANLDIPYLLWFSWAMMFYARIISTGDTGAYLGFAAAGALAIATKDQAFGFFVAPAVHVAVLRYRRLIRASGAAIAGAWHDGVVPRAALVGIATLVVAYNLPFNWSGFVDHVDEIRRNGSGKYRMVPSSLEGQLTLLQYTLRQIRFAFGWPGTLLVCAGIWSAVSQPNLRSRLWMLLPALSYYCFFIAPTSIVFDRFVIGICMLLILITACAVEAWMQGGRRVRYAAMLAVGIVSVYSVARAVSLDVLMATDSRYYVERWVARELPRDVVAALGPESFMPRIDWIHRIDLWATELPASVEYVVLNGTYAQRFDPETMEGAFYDRVRNSREFSPVLRYRSRALWPLSRDPMFADVAEDWFSNMDKVNPLIEVYKRTGSK